MGREVRMKNMRMGKKIEKFGVFLKTRVKVRIAVNDGHLHSSLGYIYLFRNLFHHLYYKHTLTHIHTFIRTYIHTSLNIINNNNNLITNIN